MNHVCAIAGREVRSFLASPLGYVFLVSFVLVAMAIFFVQEAFFASNEASARGLFEWMPALLALGAPALTMRLWAEERKLGTYELLSTMPIRPVALVLGKFLAAMAILGLALVFTLGIPIVIAKFGDPDWGPIVGGYLAAFLMGSAYLAIGLVSSAAAQDQFVALFLGWALCGLTLLPSIPFWEHQLGSSFAETLQLFGFMARFDSVERGVIDFGDLAVYLSVTAFFLYLNVVQLRLRRYES